MANTTFSGPIKAGNIFNTTGTTVGTNVSNVGFVVMSQTDTIAFGNTTDKSLSIVIPANSQLVDIKVFVITAFNAGTTNTLDIGIVGDSDLYVDDAEVGTAGDAALGATALVANWSDIGTTDVKLAAKYIQTGTAASAGGARIVVSYVQNNNLI
jgi:hypothetical protein